MAKPTADEELFNMWNLLCKSGKTSTNININLYVEHILVRELCPGFYCFKLDSLNNVSLETTVVPLFYNPLF